MRIKKLIPIAAILFLAGCVKNNLHTEKEQQTKEQAFKAHVEKQIADITTIRALQQHVAANSQNPAPETAGTCNKVVICHKGKYNEVNKSAVAAHLAHGDKLTCCVTSCINQSAALLNSGPFEWYYNSYKNDCYDYQPNGGNFVALAYEGGYIGAEAFSHHGMTFYYVYTHQYIDHSFPCLTEVTQSEFECARVYLQSYIAANACIPALCDF